LHFFRENRLVIVLLFIWFLVALIAFVLFNNKILVFFILFRWSFFYKEMLLMIFIIACFLCLIIIWLKLEANLIIIRFIYLLALAFINLLLILNTLRSRRFLMNNIWNLDGWITRKKINFIIWLVIWSIFQILIILLKFIENNLFLKNFLIAWFNHKLIILAVRFLWIIIIQIIHYWE
jgi:hypothetical protein